ncbi:hypothetical protein Hanom_Chr06g00579101 [Helianthus anomalus]
MATINPKRSIGRTNPELVSKCVSLFTYNGESTTAVTMAKTIATPLLCDVSHAIRFR